MATSSVRKAAAMAWRWCKLCAAGRLQEHGSIWVLVVLFLGAGYGSAMAGRADTILQFHHTAWTDSVGGPKVAYGVAQTDEGYLWIASASGLMRFDGIAFETINVLGGQRLSNETVFSVVARPGGELWIGYEAGFGHYVNGRYERIEPIPGVGGRVLAVDHEGVVWAVSGGRLYRLEGGRMLQMGDEWAYPPRETTQLFVDTEGGLWTVGPGPDGIYFLGRGERRFRRIKGGQESLNTGTIALAPNGDIWSLSSDGVWVVPRPKGVPGEPRKVSDLLALELLFDRNGALWVADATRGMKLVSEPLEYAVSTSATPGADDAVGTVEGLSSLGVRAIFEDREGNIWVATQDGLDRFRRSRMSPVPIKLPLSSSPFVLAPGSEGSIWAGDWNNGLYKVSADPRATKKQSSLPYIQAMSLDSRGVLWIGTGDGHVHRSEDGARLERVPLPGLPEEHNPRIDAIAHDATGSLWLGGQIGPVRRLGGGRLDVLAGINGFPSNAESQVLLVDRNQRVWIGNTSSLIVVTEGVARTYAKSDGLSVGRITSLHERGGRVWVGGSGGVAMFDGHRFHGLLGPGSVPFGRVSGVLEDSLGGLWLHTLGGAVHVSPAEVARFVVDKATTVSPDVFDSLDGLYGSAPESFPKPNLVEGSDGLVWFSRTAGLSWIDPKAIRRNTRAPQCFVRALTVDGQQSIEVRQGARLPPSPRSLEIGFTATNLTIPERTRFRYRLDGVDTEWVDSRGRRSAFYDRLSPGDYLFRIVAANEDGRWSEKEETLPFTVPPAWFQTLGFRLLCMAVVLQLLWLLYRFRVRRIEARVRIEAKAEQAERERIARELHDTLLQSTQGLVLIVQAATEQLPPTEPVRAKLEIALSQANQILLEGRDRIQDLRVQGHERDDLAESLVTAAKGLVNGRSTRIGIAVDGNVQALAPAMTNEVYWIVREALSNAIRHADPSAVEIQLVFGKKYFEVHVRDDGSGFDVTTAGDDSTKHWGLKGMSERARKVGGDLDVWSRPGAGTEIVLKIPAAGIYRSRPGGFGWARIRQMTGAWDKSNSP